MAETALVCAICRVLVTNHAYGKPLPRDVILNKASFPAHKGVTAKTAFDAVRQKPFILDYGKRGIQLDNSEFAALVQFLGPVPKSSRVCLWSPPLRGHS